MAEAATTREQSIKTSIETAKEKIHEPVSNGLVVLATVRASIEPSLTRAETGYLREIDALAGLERRRMEFETICRELGLQDVETAGDLENLLERQGEELSPLLDPLHKDHDPREAFTRLLRLRTAVETGNELRDRASSYITLEAVLRDGDTKARLERILSTKKPDSRDIKFLIDIEDRARYGFQDQRFQEPHQLTSEEPPRNPIRYERGTDISELDDEQLRALIATVDSQEKNRGPEAVSFSHYKMGIMAGILFHNLAGRFADKVGRSTVRRRNMDDLVGPGDPILFDRRVKNHESAQRFSRSLPDGLQQWVDWNSTRISPSRREFTFVQPHYGFREVIDTLFSGDGEARTRIEDAIEVYEVARENQLEVSQIASAALVIRRLIFERIVSVFSECTESLHPDIEKAARELALLSINLVPGRRIPEADSLHPFVQNSSPLADSIPQLEELAIEAQILPAR